MMGRHLVVIAVLGVSNIAIAVPANDASPPSRSPAVPPAQAGPSPSRPDPAKQEPCKQDPAKPVPPRPDPPRPDPPKQPEPAGPKISSISPAVALVENADAIILVLRGSGFEDAKDLVVSYETDPSQGSRVCANKVFVSDTELTCTIKSTPNHTLGDDLPIDQPLHFTVAWTSKDKRRVISPPSSATFTAHASLLATEMCVAWPGRGDIQMRLRVAGATTNLKVTLARADPAAETPPLPPFSCFDVHPLGTSDLVCYIERAHEADLTSKLSVKIVRALEYDATNLRTPAKPRQTVVDKPLGGAPTHVSCRELRNQP